MQQLLITIKREYWENRAVIVGIPVIIATLALIAAIGVEVVKDKIADTSVSTFIEGAIDGELSSSEKEELDRDLKELEGEIDDWSFELGDTRSDSGIEAMSIFVCFAWAACFYYLLGALYNDRKDKSILFWKSMPVSENFTVLSKLGFGTLIVTSISIVVGWVLALILFILGLGDVGHHGLSAISLYGYLIAPIEAVIVGLFWGAPVFAYLAWASAAAKRSPFLLVIVPLLTLSFLEGVVFENVEIISFFFSHMPFKVLAHINTEPNMSAFSMFFVEEAQAMLIGLVVAACFTAATIWYRNNKFEIQAALTMKMAMTSNTANHYVFETSPNLMNTRNLLRQAAYALMTVIVISQWFSVALALNSLVMNLANGDLIELGARTSQLLSTGLPVTLIFLGIQFTVAIGLSLVAASQWTPRVREQAPLFLEWSSSLYVNGALIVSGAGTYLALETIVSGNGLVSGVSSLIHALLIGVVAYKAYDAIQTDRFEQFQQWAMHTFLLISGVWVLRVNDLSAHLAFASDLEPSLLGLILSLVAMGLFTLYRHTQAKGSPLSQLILASSLILIAGGVLTFIL